MIELVCPNCGKRFSVMTVESRGWCGCGMDYEIMRTGLLALMVVWTPDPAYESCRDAAPKTERLTLAPS